MPLHAEGLEGSIDDLLAATGAGREIRNDVGGLLHFGQSLAEAWGGCTRAEPVLIV